jgi:hypothetical protein
MTCALRASSGSMNQSVCRAPSWNASATAERCRRRSDGMPSRRLGSAAQASSNRSLSALAYATVARRLTRASCTRRVGGREGSSRAEARVCSSGIRVPTRTVCLQPDHVRRSGESWLTASRGRRQDARRWGTDTSLPYPPPAAPGGRDGRGTTAQPQATFNELDAAEGRWAQIGNYFRRIAVPSPCRGLVTRNHVGYADYAACCR